MKIHSFPEKITAILNNVNAPDRLKRHLHLVYSTAKEFLYLIKKEWPELELKEELILFGSATHDIGKSKIKNELYEHGNQHEKVGKQLLSELGFTESESRFTETHGNWQTPSLPLEDLIVILADKLWKGKRIYELEEKIGQIISSELQLNYWQLYTKFNAILEKISLGADERIAWQLNKS